MRYRILSKKKTFTALAKLHKKSYMYDVPIDDVALLTKSIEGKSSFYDFLMK